MVFTLILWGFMFLLYFSSKNNKTNRWGALTLFIFSLGTFKEFLFYDLPAYKLINNGIQFPISINKETYSFMTAVLYYLAMPCFVVFSLYFCEYLNTRKNLFFMTRLCLFLPSIVLSFFYSPLKISLYQSTSMRFWYIITIYNIILTIIFTIIMISSVITVKTSFLKRQNLFVTMMILPPIWYWVITIFLIHSLKLTLFYKIWKDNIFILSISFLVYLGLACREGIMGLILHIDHYLWNSEMHFVSKEINYTFHMLKNELVKMEWCINNLNKAEEYNNREELRILEHSAGYIKQFISKNQFYSSKIILNLQNSSISELLRNAIVSFKNSNKYDIDFDCHLEADYIIPCDPVHLTEVFENLFHNAAESMKNNGKITVYLDNKIRRNMCMVMIRDEGCGITKKNLNKIFIPYFTTKKTNLNFGLGLSYCYNVIKKHKGHINVESKEGKGTTFYIYLQVK